MEFSIEMKYVLDSFWLLISGCLVMWMAAGFAMLEAGLVRTKNTTAILTKNITPSTRWHVWHIIMWDTT